MEGELKILDKVTFLFGAGAEIAYGMPSGGEFALGIFKQIMIDNKRTFKEIRNNINQDSELAKNWLPQNYKTRMVTSIAQTQLKEVIVSTLKNRRYIIEKLITEFDDLVNDIVDRLMEEGIDIDKAFNNVLDEDGRDYFSVNDDMRKIENVIYNKYIKKIVSMHENDCFSSTESKLIISDLLSAILQLCLGSLGESMIQDINHNLIKSNGTTNFIDGVDELFQVNYKNVGLKGLEILIKNNSDAKIDSSSDQAIINFLIRIMEKIYSSALDYQSLVDEYWSYLYKPSNDWAKFTKIVGFLYAVKSYIDTKICDCNLNVSGFYNDIECINGIQVHSVATTNYSKIINEITRNEYVYFLNGSTEEYYSPYLNEVSNNKDQFEFSVPFLFTQSGVKPITTISMIKKYNDFYNKCIESNTICVVGFNFNDDDAHINNIIRTALRESNVTLIIFHYEDSLIKDLQKFIEDTKVQYLKKLRLFDKNAEKLRIEIIDRKRKLKYQDKMWYQVIIPE
jgi:uncharacterized membrane protein